MRPVAWWRGKGQPNGHDYYESDSLHDGHALERPQQRAPRPEQPEECPSRAGTGERDPDADEQGRARHLALPLRGEEREGGQHQSHHQHAAQIVGVVRIHLGQPLDRRADDWREVKDGERLPHEQRDTHDERPHQRVQFACAPDLDEQEKGIEQDGRIGV